jgi:hypothetical protein
MIENIHLLSDLELQKLLVTENKRFSTGLDDGMTFLDLKQIRIDLREIAAEQLSRKTI